MITREERIRIFVAQLGEVGHVGLQECPVCGYLSWAWTNTKESVDITIAGPLTECPCCIQAMQRAPELAKWVLRVISKSQETLAADDLRRKE